jgi:CheY-like chemotaxis protein
MRLPGMDGYEVARAIRADPGLRGAHLVALSGYGRAEDVERSLRAGFDVTKPVDLGELEAKLGHLKA